MALGDDFRLIWTPFLKKRNGKMYQAVGLVCPAVLGCGGEFVLQFSNRRLTAHSMDLTRYMTDAEYRDRPPTYLWLIPRPAKPLRVRAVWKTSFGRVYRDALTLAPAQPRDIHVTFKTHIDLGYTDRYEKVMEAYRGPLLETLLDRLDATADRKPGRRFVWTLSTWLLEQCLDSGKVKPDLVKRLERHIRGGQVVWGLMPFTTHSEFFGLEEMCRSIYAARRLAERFKVPVPRAAKMTDVPAHTLSLAMAFAAAGGRFFHIGTNPDARPPDVPALFWWSLPDGGKLLCHYNPVYGMPLLPPQDWPYQQWLSVQITNDNVGPQSLDLLRHMDWISDQFDYPVCRTGRLEDFADAVIGQYGQSLPQVTEEMTDWWIHGIGSQAEATTLARRTKERLPAAETVASLASLAVRRPVSDELRQQIRQAYENLALYTEHTWGDHATDARKLVPDGNLFTSNVFAGRKTPPPLDRWVGSWADKARFACDAHDATERIEAEAFDASIRQVEAGVGDQGVMLVNSAGWSRSGVVVLADADLPSGEFELIDPTTGGTVLYDRHDGRIEFVAPPVPACGYLVLEVKPVACRTRPGRQADWDQRHLTLHSGDYSLQFHTVGGLARWHDRARSAQWCSTKADFPMGTYLYEMPGGKRLHEFARKVHSNSWAGTAGYFNRPEYADMSQFGPVGGGQANVRKEITPLCGRVVVEADCPARDVAGRRSGDVKRYRTTFTHYRGRDELYVNLRVIGKRATYAAEAGYAFFGFNGDNPWVLIDRIAHLLNPAEELAGGVNAAHMAVHRGVRVEGSYAGINFYPLDTPLISFGQPGAYAFDENGDYENGILYANLFNNCWGTNFAQWQSGDFSFNFVLKPTGNDDWDGGLARGGAEFYRPLVAKVVNGVKGARSRSVLRVESDVVQLVTLKPADFGPGTVLRLWNADVDSVKARLVFPGHRRGERLCRCDLLERPTGRAISINKDGQAAVTLKPHEIGTFLLTASKGS